MVERLFIRIVISACICTALLACALAPIPADLPSLAFGQAGLYRLEMAVMSFYGTLLLVTPTFSGLVRGRLPIEISTRGAKFAVDADHSTERNEAAIKELEQTVDVLADGLFEASLEITRLKGEVTVRD
jgi:hypothetical protein